MLQARLEVDEVLFGSLEAGRSMRATLFMFNDCKDTGVVRLDWPGLLRVNWT